MKKLALITALICYIMPLMARQTKDEPIVQLTMPFYLMATSVTDKVFLYDKPASCPYDIHLSIMYNYLSDAERTLYNRMYDALRSGQSCVKVPSGITKERAGWMADFIYNEAPELCAYDRWASHVANGSDGLEIRLAYKLSISEQNRFIQEVCSKAQSYASQGESKGLRAIHDDLCSRFIYGKVDGEDTQLAYFALKNNKAICNGYAQSFVMYAHFAGFTCSYIDGTVFDSNGTYVGRHAWNIACADGKYFWLDATWDDAGNKSTSKWYGLDGSTMAKTHVPDPEYKPILRLKTILPANVICTMHLDVNSNGGYSRGITDKSEASVQINDLAFGEYYTPALVIWNNGESATKITITYTLDGISGGWPATEVLARNNIAFRTNASQLKGKSGPHEIVWYCDGIRLGTFNWTVE